jgi:drug/metabolite transporter (DMT)-like permease
MIHGAALLFGFAGLFGKFIHLSPLIIVGGRTVLAAVSMAVVLFITGIRPSFENRKDAGVFLLLGSILAVHWVTFFHAIQISSVAIGLLTYATFPLFVTLIEPWMFQERLRALDIVTALVILGGLVLVVPDYTFKNQVTQGVFWGTVSGLTFAILSLLNRKYVQSYSSLVIAFWQNSFAFLILIPFTLTAFGEIGGRDIVLLVVLGVFCTAFAHVLFIKSLSQIRTQLASIVAGLEPVYGIVLAYLFLGEVPAKRTLLGGSLILGAVCLATLGRTGTKRVG